MVSDIKRKKYEKNVSSFRFLIVVLFLTHKHSFTNKKSWFSKTLIYWLNCFLFCESMKIVDRESSQCTIISSLIAVWMDSIYTQELSFVEYDATEILFLLNFKFLTFFESRHINEYELFSRSEKFEFVHLLSFGTVERFFLTCRSILNQSAKLHRINLWVSHPKQAFYILAICHKTHLP